MNARQLTFILIVALVLGAVGWILFHRDTSSWKDQSTASRDKVLDFPLNDVARITIKDEAGELNLVRKPEGWVVAERADYPANFEQISRFLQRIWNLKPVESVTVGPSQFARLDLTEPTPGSKGGKLLDLKNSDGQRITALLVGKEYFKNTQQSFGPAALSAGRYVMPEDASKHVFLIADPLADMVTKPERWLARDFLKIEKPKSLALAGMNPAMQWKLQRENETADWKFAAPKPGEELDKTKVTTVANVTSSLNFADVLNPDAPPATTGLDQPSTFTIETFDGFTYTLRIGKMSDDKYPVTVAVSASLPAERTISPNETPEGKAKLDEEFASRKKKFEEKLEKEKKFEGRPFLLNKFTVSQMLKNRSDLLKTEPSPAPTAAAKAPLPARSPSPKSKP